MPVSLSWSGEIRCTGSQMLRLRVIPRGGSEPSNGGRWRRAASIANKVLEASESMKVVKKTVSAPASPPPHAPLVSNLPNHTAPHCVAGLWMHRCLVVAEAAGSRRELRGRVGPAGGMAAGGGSGSVAARGERERERERAHA